MADITNGKNRTFNGFEPNEQQECFALLPNEEVRKYVAKMLRALKPHEYQVQVCESIIDYLIQGEVYEPDDEVCAMVFRKIIDSGMLKPLKVDKGIGWHY